jgi:glycosyltransferase involved in cell wall biosynthesis
VTIGELAQVQAGKQRPLTEFVSIVVPCLDEELTIGEFVEWCDEGLRRAGVEGEVIIVDSSSDRSPEIATAHGARVVRVPRLGLGRAYIDALPHIRGEWVLMGDCDLTYDFREIQEFVTQLRSGAEFVMGSRTRGEIEPGAMPRLHQYFGSPVTTFIFNRIYGTQFSDIHCGMRAMTLDAFQRMDLHSQTWEYASEMILKASRLKLRCSEVPVRFYKDRPGRQSHLVRQGWTASWKAGWETLRVQFLYAPDFFLWVPGWIMMAVGLVLSIALAAGRVEIGPIGFDLHWQLFASMLLMLGYSAVQLATLARVYYDFEPQFTRRARELLSYNRGVLTALVLIGLGLIPSVMLLVQWITDGLRLSKIDHPVVFGLTLIVIGFQTFAFTLLLHLVRD